MQAVQGRCVRGVGTSCTNRTFRSRCTTPLECAYAMAAVSCLNISRASAQGHAGAGRICSSPCSLVISRPVRTTTARTALRVLLLLYDAVEELAAGDELHADVEEVLRARRQAGESIFCTAVT